VKSVVHPFADSGWLRKPVSMKAFALLAILLLTACSTAEERRQKALMDQIEHEVRLPTGAHPLSKYARYYAFADGGVHGVYIIPWDDKALPADNECEQRNGSTNHGLNCQISLHPLKVGERRWLAESRDLPIEFEGGCNVVELHFDVDNGRVTNVACHRNA
jgi:hypothetical protein